MLLAEYDYDTDIAVQRRESFEDGFSAGEEYGRNEGISLGVQQKAIETAKTLLAFGDSIEKVSKVTGLSIEEIERL